MSFLARTYHGGYCSHYCKCCFLIYSDYFWLLLHSQQFNHLRPPCNFLNSWQPEGDWVASLLSTKITSSSSSIYNHYQWYHQSQCCWNIIAPAFWLCRSAHFPLALNFQGQGHQGIKFPWSISLSTEPLLQPQGLVKSPKQRTSCHLPELLVSSRSLKSFTSTTPAAALRACPSWQTHLEQ